MDFQKNSDFESKKITRTKINKLYNEELLMNPPKLNAVTNFKGKKEFWRISTNKNGNRIIRIESHEDNNQFEEVYFEHLGNLIYAQEAVNYLPFNHFILQRWNCQFYLDNGNLITTMSLGHGKTENDEWNPNMIFEMYNSRILELNKIKE